MWSKSGVGDNGFHLWTKMQNVHMNRTQGKACDPKDGPYVQTYKWKERLPFMVWQLENGSLQRLTWLMIVFCLKWILPRSDWQQKKKSSCILRLVSEGVLWLITKAWNLCSSNCKWRIIHTSIGVAIIGGPWLNTCTMWCWTSFNKLWHRLSFYKFLVMKL